MRRSALACVEAVSGRKRRGGPQAPVSAPAGRVFAPWPRAPPERAGGHRDGARIPVAPSNGLPSGGPFEASGTRWTAKRTTPCGVRSVPPTGWGALAQAIRPLVHDEAYARRAGRRGARRQHGLVASDRGEAQFEFLARRVLVSAKRKRVSEPEPLEHPCGTYREVQVDVVGKGRQFGTLQDVGVPVLLLIAKPGALVEPQLHQIEGVVQALADALVQFGDYGRPVSLVVADPGIQAVEGVAVHPPIEQPSLDGLFQFPAKCVGVVDRVPSVVILVDGVPQRLKSAGGIGLSRGTGTREVLLHRAIGERRRPAARDEPRIDAGQLLQQLERATSTRRAIAQACRASVADLAAIGASVSLAQSANTTALAAITQATVGSTLVAEARDAIAGYGIACAPVMVHHRLDHVQASTEGLTAKECAPGSKAASEIGELWSWIRSQGETSRGESQ